MIDIQDKAKCCGCHACYNACPTRAITMKEDEKGFKYPIINKENCINCGLCEKICPILKNNIDVKENLPEAYACKNKNDEIRMKSSSGGIFSLIAKAILNMDGVVFGARFDSEYNVVHSFIENEDEIGIFRGSKYVQSSIGDTYKKVRGFLEEDRYVLFTGTPCQIEGLKSYLRKDYEKLYTQDIICHGVPSPKVWQKYVEEMALKNNGQLKEASFRKKDNTGWNLFQISMKYNETEYVQTHKKDPYMQAFLRDLILRDSCYNCNFKKKNRNSDITLADFWGIKNVKPEMDDDKGTSLVIVNSEKGKELMKKIENEIEKEEVNFDNAIKYNPSMIKSVDMPKGRNGFFQDLKENKTIDELVKKHSTKTNVLVRSFRKFKRIITKLLD